MITNFRRRVSSSHQRPCDPGCDCDDCTARRRDELNNGIGCGPWVLLFVGYIVALTAIGISLIIISVELAR
jgi:hypothetical protein